MEETLFVSKMSKIAKRNSNSDKHPSKTTSNKSLGSHLTQVLNESKTKDATKDKKFSTESKNSKEIELKSQSISCSQRVSLKGHEVNQGENSSPRNILSMLEVNYYQCYFCDQFFKIDSRILEFITCPHKFCIKCGKIFYEEKIEEGVYQKFKCGVFRCDKEINIEIIKAIISNNHAKIIKKREKENNEANFFKDKETDIIFYNQNLKKNFSDQKADGIKLYSSNNVLDVNSNEAFYQYSKNKQLICPKCKEMSLYGKNCFHFIKCLNCFCRICKYCFKDYSVIHMDPTSFDRCKVYYRRDPEKIKKNKKIQQSFIHKYLLNLFFVVSGYFIISSIFLVKFRKSLLKSNCFLRIFLSCLYLLVFLCSLPICVFIIPYFPILASI